jgi:hypothetical protein
MLLQKEKYLDITKLCHLLATCSFIFHLYYSKILVTSQIKPQNKILGNCKTIFFGSTGVKLRPFLARQAIYHSIRPFCVGYF